MKKMINSLRNFLKKQKEIQNGENPCIDAKGKLKEYCKIEGLL